MYPSDENELLQAFVDNRLFEICESSANISESARKLREWATKYASDYNLVKPNVDWTCYILEDE